jgi:hypothetical protein
MGTVSGDCFTRERWAAGGLDGKRLVQENPYIFFYVSVASWFLTLNRCCKKVAPIYVTGATL